MAGAGLVRREPGCSQAFMLMAFACLILMSVRSCRSSVLNAAELNSLIFSHPELDAHLTSAERVVVCVRCFGGQSAKMLELRGSWPLGPEPVDARSLMYLYISILTELRSFFVRCFAVVRRWPKHLRRLVRLPALLHHHANARVYFRCSPRPGVSKPKCLGDLVDAQHML